jgi:hypothetical protein
MNASMPAAVRVALYAGRAESGDINASFPAAVRVALCRQSPEI